MAKIESGLDYVREVEALQKSPEWQLWLKLVALDRSFKLLSANCNELLKLLNVIGQEEVAWQLWNQNNREAFEKIIEELGRLLHNFVAAAKSLVDHTRRHVAVLYSGQAFAQEYEQKKKALADSPLQCFVQNLRNYAQHYALPMVGAQMHIQGDKFDSSARLDIEMLLQWDGWSKSAKEYMSEWQEAIPLHVLVENYMKLIRGFYQWLYKREEELHVEALASVRERSEALRVFGEATTEALKAQIDKERREADVTRHEQDDPADGGLV